MKEYEGAAGVWRGMKECEGAAGSWRRGWRSVKELREGEEGDGAAGS